MDIRKPKIYSEGLGEVYYNSFEDLKKAFDNSKGSKVDNIEYYKKVYIYDALKVDDFKKIYRYENETDINKVFKTINETPADFINNLKYKEIVQELNLFDSYLNDIESDIKKPQQSDTPKHKVKKENKQIISDLRDLFTDDNKYIEVMQILASEGYINPETYYWIDTGQANKQFLASLIKTHLYAKKYLKQRPKNKEVKEICKRTFGLDISIDTCKRAKTGAPNFNFIPENAT